MSNSRSKNALLNIVLGYVAQIGILLLSFVGRKIFLAFLSPDYLGINGLYSNVLSILSLAELGLDTAVVYSLYKPVAEGDKSLIYSMLKFYRRVYYVIALCIFSIGLLLIPFLQFIISSELTFNELTVYYVLFLINTVSSYFVAYKVALLSAYQEQRIHKLVTLTASGILQILHIIVLIIWKNYYVYVLATVCSTLISNFILSYVCSRRHKDIFCQTEIVFFDKTPIKDRVFQVFLYKIGTVLINSTDNILISMLVSTVAVGFYSNYSTVVNAVNGLVQIICASLVAGVGNYAASGKKEQQAEIFDMILLPFHCIGAIGLVGFSLLFNNLITLWLGKQYLFDNLTVFIISFNFYISTAIAPIWMFREANGLFDKVKFLILIRAAVNIVLSITFGMAWGVFGIFLATAVSLFVTSFWYEPSILSKDVFQRSHLIYWKKQIYYFIETAVSFCISYLVIRNWGESVAMFVLKSISVIVITCAVFAACNCRTKEFERLKGYIFK